MSEKLIITVDKNLPGNFKTCIVCGKDIKEGEDYFDYEYGGHAEIVHYDCAYPEKEENK